MIRHLGAVALAIVMTAAASRAEEIFVLQFDTPFPDVLPPCQNLVRWRSNLMLHNPAADAVEVRLLAVSNGQQQPDASPLTIPPGTTASIRGLEPPGLNWSPVVPVPVWVNKLDVPSSVIVANRAEAVIFEMLTTDPTPPCDDSVTLVSAGLPLRVFSTLVPSGVHQFHLGTDIGDFVNFRGTDARLNVGLYNDANVAASAEIQVRCSAQSGTDQPDPLVTSAILRVPAHSVAQATVVTSTAVSACPIPFGVTPYHVVVTSDQPGFSYVSAISNDSLPKFPAATSISH